MGGEAAATAGHEEPAAAAAVDREIEKQATTAAGHVEPAAAAAAEMRQCSNNNKHCQGSSSRGASNRGGRGNINGSIGRMIFVGRMVYMARV